MELAKLITEKVKHYEALEIERNTLSGKMLKGVERLESLGYVFRGVETIRLNRRFYRYARMKHADNFDIKYVNRLGGQTIGYCKNKKL